MVAHEEKRGALRCPRCGYDQAGIAATWTDQCPLAGTCSECGLEFAWADVFVPPEYLGLVEHARGVRGWAKSGLWTFLGVWRPRRFWTRLKLEHPLRVGRARLWLACAIALGVLGLPLLWRFLRLPMVKATVTVWGDIEVELKWWAECRWLTWILPGNSLDLLPDKWQSQYGWSRDWVYGLDDSWNRISNSSSWPYSPHAWWAMPLMVMCSVSPVVFVLAPQTRARAKVRMGHVARWWVYGQGWVVLLFLWQIVIVFLGLLRWGAVAALGRSGSALPTTGAFSLLHQFTVGENWYRWLGLVPAPMESMVIVPAIWFVWLMWWNWCALRIGMRLQPAGRVIRVWGLLMVVAGLVGIAVILGQEVWLGVVVPR